MTIYLAIIVAGLVSTISTIVLRFDQTLPILISKNHYGLLITTGIGPCVAIAIIAAIVSLAVSTRLRRVTDVWLAISLGAYLADCLISFVGSSRFTLGWEIARAEDLLASTIVLFTFLLGIDGVLRRLSILSNLDGLTGIANRRSLDESLAKAIAIGARNDRPLSLILFDVDHFKQYNDCYGHQAGDEALKTVASCLSTSLQRKTDFAGRYGGEEFMVVLPATDDVQAARIADQIRITVRRQAIDHNASEHHFLTLSGGVATLTSLEMRDRHAATRIVATADAALYRAKEYGRNCISIGTLAAAAGNHSVSHDDDALLAASA